MNLFTLYRIDISNIVMQFNLIDHFICGYFKSHIWSRLEPSSSLTLSRWGCQYVGGFHPPIERWWRAGVSRSTFNFVFLLQVDITIELSNIMQEILHHRHHTRQRRCNCLGAVIFRACIQWQYKSTLHKIIPLYNVMTHIRHENVQ